MALPSDLIDLLAEFAARGVEYLLVGGQAVALHGFPRFTKDVDLWLRDTPDNLQRAREALLAFGAPLATIDALEPAGSLDVVWMGSPPARIDLMKGVPGGSFDASWASRERMDVNGFLVEVVGKSDLIRLERASGRPLHLNRRRPPRARRRPIASVKRTFHQGVVPRVIPRSLHLLHRGHRPRRQAVDARQRRYIERLGRRVDELVPVLDGVPACEAIPPLLRQ